MRIEDGLIDGLFTSFDENVITWGHTTHVGCGWVQFPSQGNETKYENFMVCNYGIGVANETTCSDTQPTEEEALEDDGNNISYITYYAAPSQVIQDVKSCLDAVACRRRQLDPCNDRVEECLSAKSGLPFLKPLDLKKVSARRSDVVNGSPIDIEASKCKIDTILCSLNSSFSCRDRLRHCVPLLDDGDAGSDGTVECACADIVLANGSRGDCSETDESGQPFCFVKRSPCVAIGPRGEVEASRPEGRLNGLVHKSRLLCKNREV